MEQTDITVSEQKHVHLKESVSRSEFSTSRDHTRPLRLSFSLAIILFMSVRRLHGTHLSSGMWAEVNAAKDIDMRVTDVALTCESIVHCSALSQLVLVFNTLS